MPAGSRHLARRAAVQALYQWDITGQSRFEILSHFVTDERLKRGDQEYFNELIRDIPARVEQIDAALAPHLDRVLEQVDPIERAVLRLAAYELLEHAEVPYRVVLNEAIELAKTFGSENSFRFVNGILDKLGAEVRSIEAAVNR